MMGAAKKITPQKMLALTLPVIFEIVGLLFLAGVLILLSFFKAQLAKTEAS